MSEKSDNVLYNPPKVTIITVCYNSGLTIRDTIQSVLIQNYPNIEYIIIDGKSQDNTMEIVNEHQGKISQVVSAPDRGIYDAMNKGISLATGEIIGFLNSDDVYVDDKVVSNLIEVMIKAKSDSVFADLLIVAPKNISKVIRYYDSSKFNPSKFRFGWMPAHPTFFIKRKFYETSGLFSLEYKIAADFEILIRFLYKARASYTYLPQVVIKMRSGGMSTSSWKHSWVLNREIVAACRKNGIWTSLPIVLLKIPMKLLGLIKRR